MTDVVTMDEVRAFFGLTQTNMAELLKTSVSTIKMTERGNRKLTGFSRKMLNRITEFVDPNEIPTTKLSKDMSLKPKQKADRMLHQYLSGTILLLRKQELLLTNMATRYQQALNRRQLLQWLKAKHIVFADDELYLSLWDKTNRELEANHPALREILRLKIEINRFAIQKATELEKKIALQEQ